MATLVLAGDIMLGRGIDQILRRSVDPDISEPYVRSALTYVELAERRHGPLPRRVGPEYVWGEVLELLARHAPESARIVNLETAVTDRGAPWPDKPIQYRMHPANLDVLQAAKISAVSLANNHVLDWGRSGLLDTVRALRLAGLGVAGAGQDRTDAERPEMVVTAEGRVLLLAVADRSSGVPSAWQANQHRAGVALLPDLSHRSALELAGRIRAAWRPGDLVVVSIHWGDNWGYEVPLAEERFAKALVDQRVADVVHGHSSHHPKRIEVYKERLILYGAGDLINDYEGIAGYEAYRTDLVLLYVVRLGEDGRLEALLLLPFRKEKFRLVRANGEEAEWLRALMDREGMGASFEVTGDGLIEGRGAPPSR